ncbi:MAG: transposase [Piscinibacter sp.]|uniref:Mu transposase C-terminal domain-containing protein n=1 Tax=Piscinibacter sp. TaxID=1903157 RepID=UPI00258C1149|nr:Mu transposase C-terminal domain-containing protein [Piscinibacter sp.]MCW5666492.1 transposase [Piscinibacter sp.]
MTSPNRSAAELAGVPGMPGTRRGVALRAAAEGWPFTERPGRGGAVRLYAVDALPAETRAALAWNTGAPVVVDERTPGAPLPPEAAGRTEGARLALGSGLEQAAAAARRQAGLRQAAELAPAAQARMDACLAVLRALELHAASTGLPVKQARTAFVLAYNEGRVEVGAEVRAEVPRTSESTLERWQAQVRRYGIAALGGAYGNRAGSGKVDSRPELREFVQAMLVQHPHCRATHVLKSLRARFGAAGLPSLDALQRWMTAWRAANAELLRALANPDEWKNRHMVAFGSYSEGVARTNQLWELDSSPFDVIAQDGRYSLIGGIDVRHRRARLIVSKTSKATAVNALTRAMLLAFGVPEAVKTDNGSDYTSRHVERVFAALEIAHPLCDPFSPWQKPHIERFFGTFTRDLVELLHGYIGHSVAERKAIEARQSFAERLMKRGAQVKLLMTGAQLQEFCDRWLDDVYHHQAHEGLGGLSPFESVARSTDPIRRIEDERALDVLLAEAPENDGLRKVQKQGIRLDDAWFIAPELEAWVGQFVQVRYDALQHDLGRIFVFGGEALQFVCVAECPERTGMDRREVAIKARAMQTRRVQDERRALKAAAKKVGTDRIVDEILRERAAAAGKLAALPRPAEVHASAGLAAAAKAVQHLERTPRSTAELEDLQAIREARDRAAAEQIPAGQANELAARRGPVAAPVFESQHQRVGWLLGQVHLRELTGEERDYLASYKRQHPQSYQRLRALADEQFAATRKENDPGRLEHGTGSD